MADYLTTKWVLPRNLNFGSGRWSGETTNSGDLTLCPDALTSLSLEENEVTAALVNTTAETRPRFTGLTVIVPVIMTVGDHGRGLVTITSRVA